MRHIVDVLCICAGARRDVLNKVQDGRGQIATLGLIMILNAIIAALTSGYALSRAFLGDTYVTVIAVGGGLLWAMLVISIERLMLLSLDKLGSTQKLITQALLRVPLAIIIALVMSTPFILRLSESITDAELMKEQRETIEKEFSANAKEAGLAERQSNVKDLKAARQAIENRLSAEPSSFQYTTAKQAVQKSLASLQSVQNANAQRINRAYAEITQISRKTFDRDLPAVESARINILHRNIRSWQTEVSIARKSVEKAESNLKEAASAWQSAEAESLEKTTKDLHAAAAVATEADVKVARRNVESEQKAGPIFRSTLINQYRTYRRITSNPSHPDYAAMKVFEWAMHLLFLAIELTPIFIKVISRKGPMDDATAAVEQLDSDRVNGGANNDMARRQMIAAAKLAIEDAAIERWRDTQVAKFRVGKVQTSDLCKLRDDLDKAA